MADAVSQKIIVNLATPMSLGRICAQAAHASWLAVLNQGQWIDNELSVNTDSDPALREWLRESFTKVMLRGWGDAMLLDLKAKAEAAGLPCGLMEEDGHLTALCVGPAYTKDIDLAIGKLNLL